MQQKRDPATAAILVGLIGIVIAIGIYAPFGPPDTTQAAALAPTSAMVQSGLITTPYAVDVPPTSAPPQSTATLPPAARLQAPATAYSAPDGTIIGPIEAGREYRVLARSGAGWAQIDAAGSGAVWVRADSSLDVASAPDLATPVPPPTSAPALEQAPPQVVVVYRDAESAPAAPAPAEVAPSPLAPIPVGSCPPNCHKAEASGPPSSAGGHPEAAPQMDGGSPHASLGTRTNDGPGTKPTDPYQTQSGALLLRTATP